MRFASLGSGSRGNATLVESRATRLLIDCGLAARALEKRLAQLAVDPQTLAGILVTHEHTDHVRSVGTLARRYRLPVWMTAGTYAATNCGDLTRVSLINSGDQRFTIGDMTVHPYPVPHDAREPSQFRLDADGQCFGMVTDLGTVTPHVLEILQACDALVLECNHDREMLLRGPYPPPLQTRVGGAYGHLNNQQAAELLARLDHQRLRYLVAAHISEKNNTAELARSALLSVSDRLEDRLSVAAQDKVSSWFQL